MQKSRKQETRLPFQAPSTTFLTGNHYYSLLCILLDFYLAFTNIYSFIVCVEDDHKIDIVLQIPFFFPKWAVGCLAQGLRRVMESGKSMCRSSDRCMVIEAEGLGEITQGRVRGEKRTQG